MKQTTDSCAPLTSEMAVSLIHSQQTPAIKRSVDDMLFDNLRSHSNRASSPLSHAKSPVSIVTQSPYKLPDSFPSPVAMGNASPRKQNLLSNGNHDDDIPLLKKAKLDESYPSQNNNEHSSKTPERSSTELFRSSLLSPKSLPCTWLGSTSPLRHSGGGDAMRRESSPHSPKPPTLNPIQGYSPSEKGQIPIVIKPHVVSSPSRSSDGEMSLENTDPNAMDEGEGHEVCPECKKVFKRKIYLQRHLEREHWSTAKVFKCEDCNYETKHQSNLSVHRRTHTGERPYHCGACGQRYTQGHLLKSHIRSRHQGNMELYNLDKKSDSTRGRKSLDVKHELTSAHRQDKISTLLQAAAAASKSPAPKSPFGGILPGTGMSSYMNALSSFYSMQQPGHLGVRPMMTSPLLGNNMLPSNRFFALGGLGSNLPVSNMLPNMPSGLSLFSTASTLPKTSPTTTTTSPTKADGVPARSYSPEPGLKKIHAVPPLNLSTSHSPKLHGRSPSPQCASLTKEVDQSAVPQDLSIKPTAIATQALPHSEEPRDLSSQRSPSDHAGSLASDQNLVISGKGHSSDDRSCSDGSFQVDQMPNEDQIKSISHDLDRGDEYPTSQGDVLADPNDDIHSNENESELGAEESASRKSRSSSLDDYTPEAMSESRHTLSPLHQSHCGDNELCPHANQLKRLRKSVMQMLRCFAPEFSDKNGVNFDSPEVDDLLHDVMFSNIDDLPSSNNNVKKN